jgi:hypothetical protein
MHQITKTVNETPDLITVPHLNGNFYTTEDLKLFTETVCEELELKSLRSIIKEYRYYHEIIKEIILNISRGISSYGFVDITDTAKEFHKELFDAMYVKELEELPLMINGDWTIKPVVNWRFKIGK